MHVTVAICTHNRAGLLRNTLGRLCQVDVPEGCTWELVLVASACTDNTEETLKEFTGRLPVRLVREPVPGHSHARNAAVRAATGEYMLWTDDDVLVGLNWIHEYVSAFRCHPSAAFFGGPIEPSFESTPPGWVTELLPVIGPAFARRQLGEVPIQLGPQTLPYGANLAVKSSAQRRYLYDPALGQRPGVIGVGEETQLLRALLRDGDEGWWVPGARVRHVIPVERQRWAHVKAHWRAQGRAMAFMSAGGFEGALWFGRPSSLWRLAARAELTYRVRRLTRRRAEWVGDMGWAHITRALLFASAERGGDRGAEGSGVTSE